MISPGMYKKSLHGLDDERELLNFIEKNYWPVEMHNLRHNILRCTVLHQELIQTQENDDTVLTSLLKAFHGKYPKTRDDLLEKHESRGSCGQIRCNAGDDKSVLPMGGSSDFNYCRLKLPPNLIIPRNLWLQLNKMPLPTCPIQRKERALFYNIGKSGASISLEF